MRILVVGASGATGKQLVKQLLNKGHEVIVIVRSAESLPGSWQNDLNLTVVQASLLHLVEERLEEYVQDCQGIVSCLGHNLTLKGIFGEPRKLVTDAVTILCRAIRKNAPDKRVKFVLMNTTGNRNRDLNEPASLGQRLVVGALRRLLPPHLDNEEAADFLRTHIGQHDQYIEWVAVRPDSLIDQDEVTGYEVYPSPIRSPIFNAGTTSRMNVGHFMASLLTEDETWQRWKGKMPVIYNKEPARGKK
ncbi:MAG: NAD(P)H-binding protein [Imperialibacter sp.]|uniref:NAD(P)-dependent oxidoreductase n=1 Tax=Imperialibacter sp. TaxID=2038411 RepID=UPI0032EFEF92